MTDVVFARANVWMPRVVRRDGRLVIEVGAGADANHDPRTFAFPVDETQLAVIRQDLARHLLLWSAILPLCDAAGSEGPLDEMDAVALLNPILLADPGDIDALFRRIRWDRSQLVAHGADVGLLEGGHVWAAMRSATVSADLPRAQEHDAARRRAEAGVVLSRLDAEILKFIGHYRHGGASIPQRLPGAVDPAYLSAVLRVIATAERACTGMRIRPDPRKGTHATNERDWDRLSAAVHDEVRGSHPDLAIAAVDSVSFLMCSEAADRSRRMPGS